MPCAYCSSQETVKNGTGTRQGRQIQRYLCRTCGKRFNDWTNTPMARPELVSTAINVRTEGLGVRATGRSFGKSHASIIRWEHRLADQGDNWSPPAPAGAEVTLEGDEVYTRVGENLPPPSESEGWTVHFIERETRYWVAAAAGRKETPLFEQCTATVWTWASPAQFIRWFTVRVACRRLRGGVVWPGGMESGQRVPACRRYPAVLPPSKSWALWFGGSDDNQRFSGATARRMG
jgi:transposase-like protein